MSYEEDEKLVKQVLQSDEQRMEQAKEAVRWNRIDNIIDIVTTILQESGRWAVISATYVQSLAYAAYDWLCRITDL